MAQQQCGVPQKWATADEAPSWPEGWSFGGKCAITELVTAEGDHGIDA